LHSDVPAFSMRLPAGLVGVVGVPRSGLMVASLLALHRHVHLADADTFARSGGFYTPGARLAAFAPSAGKVLLLDDSVLSCRSIDSAERRIREGGRCGRFELIRGAFYAAPAAAERLDVFCRVVPMPRAFQWNWLAHQHLGQWTSDLDGVVCRDPAVHDDDGPQYEAAIRNAAPLYLPQRPIRSVITCRVERWRAITEDWLRRHHVQAQELILHPAPNAQARRRQGNYGRWKGEQYRRSPSTLFIESSARQALAIAEVSQKPVLCLENMKVYQ
jgi:uncharacterized HAD superfamily protein